MLTFNGGAKGSVVILIVASLKLGGGSVNIQELVRSYREKWIKLSQWYDPDLRDCLDFMVTEVAEAVGKRLKKYGPQYTRNNPVGIPTDFDIAVEVFDAIMMGCVALDILGYDLIDIADSKLKAMDSMRVKASREERI